MLTSSALATASSSAAHGGLSIHVQQRPSARQDLGVSFRPLRKLPVGGYYYAVIVLKPYKSYTRAKPPPCSTSSDMERTDYGYPRTGRSVRLKLTPSPSAVHEWCRGGSYVGGVYAVPHAPPCEARYPCSSEPYERSPCFEIERGRRACGVVVQPTRYSYPDGLPAPIAPGTRIVGRFAVTFR